MLRDALQGSRSAREPARAGGFGSRRSWQGAGRRRLSEDATLDNLLRRAAASRGPGDPLRFDAPPTDEAEDAAARPTLFVWRDGADPTPRSPARRTRPAPVTGAPDTPIVAVSTCETATLVLFDDGAVCSLDNLSLTREPEVQALNPTTLAIRSRDYLAVGAKDGVYLAIGERRIMKKHLDVPQCCALDADVVTASVDGQGRARVDRDLVAGDTVFRACACGQGFALFLGLDGSIVEVSGLAPNRSIRRLPWPHAAPVALACHNFDAVACCRDGTVVQWALGSDDHKILSATLARENVRIVAARVFDGAVVATSAAGNCYRSRHGAPLHLLRVFADAGLCVEESWPLVNGGVLVAVAARPAPVAESNDAPPYAAPPPWAPPPKPAPVVAVDAPDAARCGVSGPLWDACHAGEALPAGWHEATIALRDRRGRSVARGGWRVECSYQAQTEVVDRGDGVYVIRVLAGAPEVALTVTVTGEPVADTPWRARVVAAPRPRVPSGDADDAPAPPRAVVAPPDTPAPTAPAPKAVPAPALSLVAYAPLDAPAPSPTACAPPLAARAPAAAPAPAAARTPLPEARPPAPAAVVVALDAVGPLDDAERLALDALLARDRAHRGVP